MYVEVNSAMAKGNNKIVHYTVVGLYLVSKPSFMGVRL